MIRRPIVWVCLSLMLFLWIMNGLGIPVIRGNPLPDSIKSYLETHPRGTVCGVVVSSRQSEHGQTIFLRNSNLIFHSEKYPIHNIQIYMEESCEAEPGSFFVVEGTLEEIESPGNPGEFDFRQYAAGRHQYYQMKKGRMRSCSQEKTPEAWLSEFREYLKGKTALCAKEAEGIFDELVLGDRSGLEAEQRLRYQMAGILAILVISGTHISMLGLGSYRLLKKAGTPPILSGGGSLAIVLLYSLLGGSGTSSVRAVCMYVLSMSASLLGRIYDLPTALALAAILILAESPAYLLGSGFLLSFGAVIGAGVVSPLLIRFFEEKKKWWKMLLSSLGVTMTILPILLYTSGEVSIAGIALNLLVLPTAPVLLASAMGTAVLGSFSVRLGSAAALPGRGIVQLYEGLTRCVGYFPAAVWNPGSPPIGLVVIYYGLLFGGSLWIKKTQREKPWEPGRRKPLKRRKKVGIFLLGIGILLGVISLRPPQRFSVTFLDIGQGDGAVIETENGEAFLVDCGSSSKNSVGQYQLLPYLKYRGIRHLDGIFLSHTDQDHINGIIELFEMQRKHLTYVFADRLILPELSDPPEAWQQLKTMAEELGMEVIPVRAGDTFLAGDEKDKKKTVFRILAPAEGAKGVDVNADSVVMEVEGGGIKGLFTGDIPMETEELLLKQGVLEDVDFLKTAHHGSRYSTCEDFLKTVSPEIAVVSCSKNNRYHHPAKETMERLEQAGCRIFYTMHSGAVTIEAKTGGYICRTHR